MKNVYYHVVTSKPLHVGQTIIFDDTNHSGVYERVYALEDKVKDIYSNPDKYIDAELGHHLKVALRELALEKTRKEKYSLYPSRLSSLYVSNTLEEAQKWYDLFLDAGREVYSIVKVEVNGSVFVGDAWNCFDGTIDEATNLKKADYYWSNKKNKHGKEPIVEILVNGEIKVIEIVKQSFN